MTQEPSINIDTWLENVRAYVKEEESELLPTFDTYSNEARFGRKYIASDLLQLSKGASILEVGAGSLLLSCQLKREGFDITALEPISIKGFSHFEKLQDLVLCFAKESGHVPRLLEQTAETSIEQNDFEYAFSINVMEHVADINKVILNVSESLKVGSHYRFTCPNYLFPYEPHFNIPTLFSKKVTEKLFFNYIFKNKLLPDPSGTWESLNWINTIQIKKSINSSRNLKISFNRSLLVSTLERISTDSEFAKRRSKSVCWIISVLVKSRLHTLVGFIPAMFQPIIDCEITREVKKEVL